MGFELTLAIIIIVVSIYLLACIAMYLFQERLIFVPAFRTPLQPVEVATPLEEFEIDTPNNGKIHAILMRSEECKGLIFYLHGNTGTLRRWQFMAEELLQYGYDVFAIDYRGFGKSTGKRKESFMHEDAQHTFAFINEQYTDKPFIVYGRSLGTGFACHLASRVDCQGVVLETPFSSMISVANAYFPYMLNKLLLRFRLRSDREIQKVSAPILMLQGTKDRVVPFRSAKHLYDQVAERDDVKFVTLVGGRHSDLNKFPLFISSLRAFFEEVAEKGK